MEFEGRIPYSPKTTSGKSCKHLRVDIRSEIVPSTVLPALCPWGLGANALDACVMLLIEGVDCFNALLLHPAGAECVNIIAAFVSVREDGLGDEVPVGNFQPWCIEDHEDHVFDVTFRELVVRLACPDDFREHQRIGAQRQFSLRCLKEERFHRVCLFGNVVEQVSQQNVRVDERVGGLPLPARFSRHARPSWLVLLLRLDGLRPDPQDACVA